MALFDRNLAASATYRTPRYGGGNLFMDDYGKSTFLGDVAATALPILGTVGGAVASGLTGIPGLAAAGTELGKLGAQGVASIGAGGRENFVDAQANAEESKAKMMGLASIGGAVGDVATPFLNKLGTSAATTPPLVPELPHPAAIVPGKFNLNPTPMPSILPPMPGAKPNMLGSGAGQPPTPLFGADGIEMNLFGGKKPRNATYFEKGGSVVDYHYGPLKGRAKTDRYTIYAEGDDTEDLTISRPDKSFFGALRKGEYIINQARSLAAADIIHGSASQSEKEKALGSLLHEQLTSAPPPTPLRVEAGRDEPAMFQGGGSVGFMRRNPKPVRATSSSIMPSLLSGAGRYAAAPAKVAARSSAPAQKQDDQSENTAYSITSNGRIPDPAYNPLVNPWRQPAPSASAKSDSAPAAGPTSRFTGLPGGRIPDRTRSNPVGSEAIKAHQRELNNQGYKGANGKALAVDGIAGKETAHAEATHRADFDHRERMAAIDARPMAIRQSAPLALPDSMARASAQMNQETMPARPAMANMAIRQPAPVLPNSMDRATAQMNQETLPARPAAPDYSPMAIRSTADMMPSKAHMDRLTERSRREANTDIRYMNPGPAAPSAALDVEPMTIKQGPVGTPLAGALRYGQGMLMSRVDHAIDQAASNNTYHANAVPELLRDVRIQQAKDAVNADNPDNPPYASSAYQTYMQQMRAKYEAKPAGSIQPSATESAPPAPPIDPKKKGPRYFRYGGMIDDEQPPGKESIPTSGRQYVGGGSVDDDPVAEVVRSRQKAALAKIDAHEADINRAYAAGKMPKDFDVVATRKKLTSLRDQIQSAEKQNVSSAGTGAPATISYDYDAEKLIQAEKAVGTYVDGDAKHGAANYETSVASRKIRANGEALGLDLMGRKAGDPSFGMVESIRSGSKTRIYVDPITHEPARDATGRVTDKVPTAGVPAPVTKAAPTSLTTKPAGGSPAPAPTTGGGGGRYGGGVSMPRTAAPAPVAPTPAATPAKTSSSVSMSMYTVKKGDTLSGIAKANGGLMADYLKYNHMTDPNKLEAGQVLTLAPTQNMASTATDARAATATTDLQTAMGRTDRQVAGLNAGLAITNAANKPTAPVLPSTVDAAKLTTGIADAGRLIAGVGLASAHVPLPTVPERWQNYTNEVAAMKNQGLSAAEMTAANQNVANNYRQGAAALTNAAGGGSAPGTVLAGLSNLGLQRGQQNQAVLAADAARQQQNFGRYGAVTAQTAGMEAGIQQESIARQTAAQGVGQQLIGQTLQNAENRQVMATNQPLYDAVMKGQIDERAANTATQQALRDYYRKRADAVV